MKLWGVLSKAIWNSSGRSTIKYLYSCNTNKNPLCHPRLKTSLANPCYTVFYRESLESLHEELSHMEEETLRSLRNLKNIKNRIKEYQKGAGVSLWDASHPLYITDYKCRKTKVSVLRQAERITSDAERVMAEVHHHCKIRKRALLPTRGWEPRKSDDWL